MNPIDLGVIVVYVVGCTALGAWLGSRPTGLKGYFLGESNIPAWAVMISIVATETSTVDVPERARASPTRATSRFLQLALGYILGRIVVAVVLLPAYFRGEIYTAYQVLRDAGSAGATRTTASVLFLVTRTLADGLRLFLAAKVLEQITGWPIAGVDRRHRRCRRSFTPTWAGIKAVIWTDVHPVLDLHPRRAGRAGDPGPGKLPGGWRELWRTAGRRRTSSACSTSRFDLTRALHLLGRADRRHGAEHRRPTAPTR